MKDERTMEIELYDMKWFDYRPIHPDVATLVFFLEFIRAQRTYNDELGYTVYVNVLKGYPDLELDGMRKHRDWAILTKLRRYADRNFMEYSLFWRFVTQAHLQLGFYKRFLKVYSRDRVLAKALEYRDEYVKNFIVYSKHPMFEARNYGGFTVQDDYYEYVLAQLSRRKSAEEFSIKVKKLMDEGKLPVNFNSKTNVIKHLLKKAA